MTNPNPWNKVDFATQERRMDEIEHDYSAVELEGPLNWVRWTFGILLVVGWVALIIYRIFAGAEG